MLGHGEGGEAPLQLPQPRRGGDVGTQEVATLHVPGRSVVVSQRTQAQMHRVQNLASPWMCWGRNRPGHQCPTPAAALTACYTGSRCPCPCHSSPSLSPRCSASRSRTCQRKLLLKRVREVVKRVGQWPAVTVMVAVAVIVTVAVMVTITVAVALTLSPDVFTLSVPGFALSIEAATLTSERRQRISCELRLCLKVTSPAFPAEQPHLL